MCNLKENTNQKSPVEQVEQQISDKIGDVDEYLEKEYYVTLDQLDDLQSVKDELESAKSTLEDQQYQMDEITSALENAKDACSNADYHG